MSFNKKTIEDVQVKGKRVLVRCDFNVPLKDGVITDENRLVGALPTIKYLIENGAKVILCSHLGKDASKSLAPVAVRLSEMLGKEVVFARDEEVVGENARKAVADMKDGDVVLLENTRCRKEETKNGEELSKELASLCDIYVNDAFGTAHRAHSSTVGVTNYVDTAVCGYLIQKELKFCSCLSPSDNRLCIIIFMPLHAIIPLKKQYFNKQYCFTHLVSKILYFYKLY